MAKGKIAKRIGEKVWPNPKSGKNVYFTSIEMDNGDKGESWCDNSGELKEGEEIEYELIPREGKSNTIKLKRSGSFGGGFKGGSYQKEDVEFKLASFGWSYAKDLVVGGKLEAAQMPVMAEKMALGIQSLTSKLKSTAPKSAPDATA